MRSVCVCCVLSSFFFFGLPSRLFSCEVSSYLFFCQVDDSDSVFEIKTLLGGGREEEKAKSYLITRNLASSVHKSNKSLLIVSTAFSLAPISILEAIIIFHLGLVFKRSGKMEF